MAENMHPVNVGDVLYAVVIDDWGPYAGVPRIATRTVEKVTPQRLAFERSADPRDYRPQVKRIVENGDGEVATSGNHPTMRWYATPEQAAVSRIATAMAVTRRANAQAERAADTEATIMRAMRALGLA